MISHHYSRLSKTSTARKDERKVKPNSQNSAENYENSTRSSGKEAAKENKSIQKCQCSQSPQVDNASIFKYTKPTVPTAL